MSSNLLVIALILAVLAALASFAGPTPGNSARCCGNKYHGDTLFGDLSYCPVRGS